MLLETALPGLMAQESGLGKGRRTFGSELPSEGVPPVLATLCETIIRDGIEREGLFRLAGSASKIRKLKADLNNNCASFATPEVDSYFYFFCSTFDRQYHMLTELCSCFHLPLLGLRNGYLCSLCTREIILSRITRTLAPDKII